jgi:thiamine biosynthesis lipoprotein ApbE
VGPHTTSRQPTRNHLRPRCALPHTPRGQLPLLAHKPPPHPKNQPRNPQPVNQLPPNRKRHPQNPRLLPRNPRLRLSNLIPHQRNPHRHSNPRRSKPRRPKRQLSPEAPESRHELGENALIASAKWKALGTNVDLRLSSTDGGDLRKGRTIAERELQAVDLACSRFREDSELSRVNARSGRLVPVGPLLIEAVQVALRAAELTDGDVDLTLGSALRLAGYNRDWGLMGNETAPSIHMHPEDHEQLCPAGPVLIARMHAGWREVELDPEQRVIRVARGIELDLGATAKAFAADRISRLIYEQTGCAVLLSLGGDIATAGSPPHGDWPVHVTDDHRDGPSAPGQTISIAGGGLATSSTTARRWSRDGVQMHHIIDPTTRLPTRGIWRTASVAAADCTDANIASTAAIVRSQAAPSWLESLGLAARLVDHEGTVVKVGQWPSETSTDFQTRASSLKTLETPAQVHAQ